MRQMFLPLVFWTVALPSCATLPGIQASLCGNGVLDPGEECDSLAPSSGGAACAAPGAANQCRFVCSSGASCPAGYGCGSDLVCRKATGSFESNSRRVTGELVSLELADFDGDGHEDVLAQGKTSIRVNYMDKEGYLAKTISVPISRGRITCRSLSEDKLATITLLDTELSGGATGGGLSVFRGRPDRSIAPMIYPFVPFNVSDPTFTFARLGTLGQLGAGREFVAIADNSAFERERGKGYSLLFYDVREDGSNENIPLFPLRELDQWLKPSPEGGPPIGTGTEQIGEPISAGRFISAPLTDGGKPYPCDTILLAIKDPSSVQVLPLCSRKDGTPNKYPFRANASDPGPGPDDPPEKRIRLQMPSAVNVAGPAYLLNVNAMAKVLGFPAEDNAVPIFGAAAKNDLHLDVVVPVRGGAVVGFGDGTGHARSSPSIETVDDLLTPYPGLQTTDDAVPLVVGDLNGDGVLDWVEPDAIRFNPYAFEQASKLMDAAGQTSAAGSYFMYSLLLRTRPTVKAPGGSKWRGARIMDLNNDGAPDVVAYSESSLDVYKGTPASENPNNVLYPLFSRMSYPVDGTILKIATGDADADGNIDIALATRGDTSGLSTDAIYVLFGTKNIPEPPRFVGRLPKVSQLEMGQINWLLVGAPDRFQSVVAIGTGPTGIPFGAAMQGSADRSLTSRFGLVSLKNSYIRDIGLSAIVGRFLTKEHPAVVSIGFGTERQEDDRSGSKQAMRFWVVPASGDADFDPAGVQSSVPFAEKGEDFTSRGSELLEQMNLAALAAVDLDADELDEAVAFIPTSAKLGDTGQVIVVKPTDFDSVWPKKVGSADREKLKKSKLDFGQEALELGRSLASIVGDISGDGAKDVVVTVPSRTGLSAYVFVNDGSGTLDGAKAIKFEASADKVPLAFAVTQEAKGQLAVLYSGEVQFFQMSGTSLVPSGRPSVSISTTNGVALVFGDVNGDGVRDMVVGSGSGFEIYLGTAVNP